MPKSCYFDGKKSALPIINDNKSLTNLVTILILVSLSIYCNHVFALPFNLTSTVKPAINTTKTNKTISSTQILNQRFIHVNDTAMPADDLHSDANDTVPADALSAVTNVTVSADALSAVTNVTVSADALSAVMNVTVPANALSSVTNVTVPADALAAVTNDTEQVDDLYTGGDDDVTADDLNSDVKDNVLVDDLYYVGTDEKKTEILTIEQVFSNRTDYLHWLASEYAWHKIQVSGLLRVGQRNSAIKEIHERLILLGDSVKVDTISELYTDELAKDVRNFQQRHGLTDDAIIGPETLKWLNINPHRKADLLSLNMIEKIDFMENLGTRYLIVNIPAYELLLRDKGQIALRSRVIVGKPQKPTPIMTSEIKSLVINPSWRVPRSILEDDLLPKVQLDGNFLNLRNFNVFNYQNQKIEKSAEEWQQLASGNFPYRLEQEPGITNVLGRYKFYFPNDFSVYLHDTTNPKLFNQSNRALSSGCIRIEKVDELADWIANSLVDNKKLWSKLKFSPETTKWFQLNDVLPVHLVYWTAWIDDSGLSQFRDDIYALQR